MDAENDVIEAVKEIEDMEVFDSGFETLESEVLDPLMEAFYTPVDIASVISEVSHNVFIIMAVIVGVFPILYMFKRFIRYAEKAFDAGAMRELESGGLWRKMPDGSLYGGLARIAEIPAFKKALRK